MQSRKYLLIAIAIVLMTIFVYVVCFYKMPLSEQTSDWGAFGSYIGMGGSVLSVALIYITYNEQRHSNLIEGFEQHLKLMIDTLSKLTEQNRCSLEKDYQSFMYHFKDPFYDMSSYEAKNVGIMCTYYFSQIIDDKKSEYDNLLKYLSLTIQHIKNEKLLPKKGQEGRVIELSCILPECMRTFYFCWLIQQNEYNLLEYCYLNGFFISDEPNDDLLSDIIKLVCTGKKSEKKGSVPISPESIEFEDYSNEPFDETYNRLFNTKK